MTTDSPIPADITVAAQYHILDEDPFRGWRLTRDEQYIIYHVWTIGLYHNGHPMFDLRAVTTSMAKAKLYSKMLRRDKEANGETWYRVHIEPRVANHLYAACMRDYREAVGKLPGSPKAKS